MQVALVVAGGLVVLASSARADSLTQEQRRLELTASVGEFESMITSAVLDQRIRGPQAILHRGDHGLGVTTFDLEHVAFFGRDGVGVVDRRFAWSIAGLRYQRDHDDDASWYVELATVTSAAGSLHPLTPKLGLRVGRLDRTALIAEAAFRAWDANREIDVDARASTPLASVFRLEARGRYRDATFEDVRLRDLFGALGIEFSASTKGPWGGRTPQFFIGFGVQRGTTSRVASDAFARVVTEPEETRILAWVEIALTVSPIRSGW